jgi:hypothetical protein
MLSNPLPQVIKQPSIELEQKHADAPVEDCKAPEDERLKQSFKPTSNPLGFDERTVLILHTRDVTDDEEQLCRKFGVVRHFNPSMVNIQLETVKADYIFVDVRVKFYRIHIAKIDTSKFRICSLVNSWQKRDNIFDDFVDEINIMTKIPEDKVTYKHEFDDLLVCKKLIKSPGNSCLSFLSYVVNIFEELKRKS